MQTFRWILLCVCAIPVWASNGKPCICVDNVLDCSSREKTSLTSEDICYGATKINLYNNDLTEFPSGLKERFIDVDVSFNRLTTLPSSSLLDPKTKNLRLAGNELSNTTDELRTMSSLHFLDVSENQLTSLQFLPSVCALRELDASENQIVSIEGPLKGCVELESLILTDNKLVTLHTDVFDQLSHLQELDLRENHLSEIVGGTFQGLIRLEYLDLRSNRLTVLRENAFRGLHSLKTLHLSTNPLLMISRNTFPGLFSLEHLHISETRLTMLSAKAFEDMTQLKTLHINRNKLTSLPKDIFKTLKNVEEINMQGTRLHEITQEMFSATENLKQLLLERNLLTNLPQGVFHSLNRLVTLDLDGNRLQELRTGTLSGLPTLKKLSLRYNRLVTLPLLDDCCEQLNLVSFRHNNITEANQKSLKTLLRRGITVDIRNNVLKPSSLLWAVDARDVRVEVDEDICACGKIRSGSGDGSAGGEDAAVYLCVDAPCGEGSSFANWVDAVRAAAVRST